MASCRNVSESFGTGANQSVGIAFLTVQAVMLNLSSVLFGKAL